MRPGPFTAPEEAGRIAHGGERYVPLIAPYNAAMHLGHMAAYKYALRYAYGRHVLDVGCGTGYGPHYLASFGAHGVTGVDVDEAALEYAHVAYAHSRVQHLCCDGQRLPYTDASFDFVLSSQVIEHIPDPKAFLAEIKRVLRPEGACLITTPNKDLFSPSIAASARGFHLHEMSPAEFEALGNAVFPKVEMAGIPQNCIQRKPDGSVGLKPNEMLHLEDYQVQQDDLAHCENILLLGYKQEHSPFCASLPDSLSYLSTRPEPCFWDATASQWIELGLYPASSPVDEFASGAREVVWQTFRSPSDCLFQMELMLRSKSIEPVEIVLREHSRKGQVLARALVRPVDGRLRMRIEPIRESAGREFCLEIRHQRSIWGTVLRGSHKLPQFESRGGRLALWTFHQTLPPAQNG